MPPSHRTAHAGVERSLATPLALAYVTLVVYASLYPFAGWHDPGVAPWGFVFAPWPRYWSGFDVGINIAGYIPLGCFVGLGLASTRNPPHTLQGFIRLLLACVVVSLLSLALETLQSYLPSRVPSKLDWALNSAGGVAGVVCAHQLHWRGVVGWWHGLRRRWFVRDARGPLVLLALWPWALLFPTPLPFGLGQVLAQAKSSLYGWLLATPFAFEVPSLPLAGPAGQPGFLNAVLLVALGALMPCYLAYSIVPAKRHRLLVLVGILALGWGVISLSSALSFGPSHAFAWLGTATWVGLGLALGLGLGAVFVSVRLAQVLALLAVAWHVSNINLVFVDPYFTQTVALWEQGAFIRFHGLSQLLGWGWPFAALWVMVVRLTQR